MPAIGTLLIVTFFITSSDSGSLVDDMVTSGGHPDPPTAQRVFWAFAEGAVAGVLLYTGGLSALQTASIVSGLPLTILLLLTCYGLVKSFRIDVANEGNIK
jgi:choline/glycine/proline betaine transport protein